MQFITGITLKSHKCMAFNFYAFILKLYFNSSLWINNLQNYFLMNVSKNNVFGVGSYKFNSFDYFNIWNNQYLNYTCTITRTLNEKWLLHRLSYDTLCINSSCFHSIFFIAVKIYFWIFSSCAKKFQEICYIYMFFFWVVILFLNVE